MNIFNYGIRFVAYWLLLEFLSIFLGPANISDYKKIFVIIIDATILYFFNLLEISWMNPIITYIILISSAQFLYHAKLQAILILSLFGVACSVVCEFICVATLSTLLMSKIQAVLQTTHGLLLTSITSRFLLFLSNQIIKVYVQCKTRANNYRISSVFISPIISMFIMYSLLEFDQFLPHTSKYSIWLSSIYFILLIMNLIVFKIYDDKQKYYDIQLELQFMKQLQTQQENILKIHQDHMNELSCINHDFKNHLISLQSLLFENPSEAIQYIQDLTGNLNLKKQKSYLYTNNSAINAILSYNEYRYNEAGIQIDYQINPADFSFLSYSDACAIFSNALDNSFEACQKALALQIPSHLTLSISQYHRNITIGVKNTKVSSDKTKKIKGKYISSKYNKQSHGYGLLNIEEAVKKNAGSIIIEELKNEFSIIILLPIP